jgi:hypothetical protein
MNEGMRWSDRAIVAARLVDVGECVSNPLIDRLRPALVGQELPFDSVGCIADNLSHCSGMSAAEKAGGIAQPLPIRVVDMLPVSTGTN